MTGRRRAFAGAAGVLALLVLSSCAAPSATPTSQSGAASRGSSASQGSTVVLRPQTATAGPVEVKVTPGRVDGGTAEFTVALDNHQVDLTGDYAATSTLTVGGTKWPAGRWSGAPAGGHHREGTLTFTSQSGSPSGSAAPAGELVLDLGGLPAPVTLRWTITGSGS